MKYDIFQKAGRLTNGNQADHGSINHAVVGSAEWCKGKALCGTEPARKSVGWVKPSTHNADKITCQKCIIKLNKLEGKMNKTAKNSQYKSKEMVQISRKDFFDTADNQYGVSSKDWQLVCPRCGTVQSGQDFIDAGVDKETAQNQFGFSCIGRSVKNKGCDWTLGGLFKIHEIEIIDEEGVKHPFFRLATAEEFANK